MKTDLSEDGGGHTGNFRVGEKILVKFTVGKVIRLEANGERLIFIIRGKHVSVS